MPNFGPFPEGGANRRFPVGPSPGEHGFRFFPAYYLHTWDLFNRIPIYQHTASATGIQRWTTTSRTVWDNVRRVVTQGTTVNGKPSLVFPREAPPRSLAEFISTAGQLTEFGFTATDVQTFVGRLLRYLVTSPLRRATELENLSAYDYFVGRQPDGTRRFSYTPAFRRPPARDAQSAGRIRFTMGG